MLYYRKRVLDAYRQVFELSTLKSLNSEVPVPLQSPSSSRRESQKSCASKQNVTLVLSHCFMPCKSEIRQNRPPTRRFQKTMASLVYGTPMGTASGGTVKEESTVSDADLRFLRAARLVIVITSRLAIVTTSSRTLKA